MYRVLKQTGSIYIQCDYRINHWIRYMMDDIFGYENLRNEIVWKRRSSANNVIKNSFLSNKDYIIFYSKNKIHIFNTQYSFDKLNKEPYSKTDKNGDVYRECQIVSKTTNPLRTLIFNGKEYTNHYKWTQETLNKRIAEGYIITENSKGDLNYRIYLKNNKGKMLDDIWDDVCFESRSIYDTQKPKELLERIIKASSNKGDIVADFFMGSGTTGEVALELDRNFIGCDTGDKACEITKTRLEGIA